MLKSEDVQGARDPVMAAQSEHADGITQASAPDAGHSQARAPGWIRRRARNVYRRPLLVSVVGLAVFVAVLIAAVIAPLNEQREVLATLPPVRARPDTADIRRHIRTAGSVLEAADSALDFARRSARAAPSDTVAPRTMDRRDSVVAEVAGLAALLRRTRDAPLASSYRAIALAPALHGDRRVTALSDTLSRIEARRAAFGTSGGADPVFVALTTRLTQIGKQLERIADARRAALESELSRRASAASADSPIDTVALLRTRDSAVAAAASARRWLAQARDVERDMDATDARARAAAALGASVPAMVAGAAALAAVVGFAAALALEVRAPRVSDGDEAESIAGASVLTAIDETPRTPVRRRRADFEMPPLIDLASDSYRLLFAQLADRADNLPLLSMVGDDAITTATVAANLGAVAARQVREVLVIDTDVERQSLSSVMRVRGTPGLVDVLAGRVEWAAAVRNVLVDRDRTLDVLPSGAFGAHELIDSMSAEMARLLDHVARRYDCVILSAPLSARGNLSLTGSMGSPVLIVRSARTTICLLGRLTASLRARGAAARGVVMWNRAEPIALSA